MICDGVLVRLAIRLLSDSVIDDLIRLGLTLNEARAYKALVQQGNSTAREIAEVSGIPRSKVYETVGLLEKRGIIQRVLGREPATFKAAPPRTTIEFLRKKLESSSESALAALENLESERESVEEEFVWTTQGDEQINLGIMSALEGAKRFIFIATRLPSLLSPLRSSFSGAKARGVNIELHTTGSLVESFEPFRHYMEIHSAIPSSEVLVENLRQVLQEIDLQYIGWNPDAMSIMMIDGIESIAIFRPMTESQKPWALHIRNPLIVTIQWQVIKTALYTIEGLIHNILEES
ncbi:MAG: TrmB family transcriptional regulator [Candidatus Thorarchaeota archaeon]